MRFIVDISLNPKDRDVHEIVRAIHQVQVMFLNILGQMDGFSNEDSRNAICLHLLGFDRVANQHSLTMEMCRTAISAEFQPADEYIRFYMMDPKGPNGEEGNWFLSSNGKDLDTPAEIFYSQLEKFRKTEQTA